MNAWEDTVLYNTEMLWKLLHYGLMAFKKVQKQFKKPYQKIVIEFFLNAPFWKKKVEFWAILLKIGGIVSRRSKEQYV